ncbi:MAG: hypothetical protein HXO19_02785 [Prevotella shahii]|jgi:hypothetical protein|uniref:hypothetical protein n=1 Tax=Hoylesella shahii TaxID=228603 RepID=UPI001CB075D6|nr:hypothetical protein [Hoylesella shahii]MBF1590039.1 hypothetical protein [Hoylesella shahii]DAX75211.1 MAG TPA: hypothetical protein [Caudoviricetes sp.]
MKSKIDRLDAIHPDLISAFLTGGKGEGIPVDIQLFLKQLQWAAEIYEYERNITRAARKLRIRINAEQGERIEERTCMSRIYQAINYFNVDCNVPIKVWENNFANKYEDLAKICAVQRDYKSQKACYDAALECRRRASEVAEADRGLGVTFILSPEITAEEMGFAKRSLKEIAAKHNRGFYINLIESLPLEKAEKKRLLRDADIEDAEIIQDIDND